MHAGSFPGCSARVLVIIPCGVLAVLRWLYQDLSVTRLAKISLYEACGSPVRESLELVT